MSYVKVKSKTVLDMPIAFRNNYHVIKGIVLTILHLHQF